MSKQILIEEVVALSGEDVEISVYPRLKLSTNGKDTEVIDTSDACTDPFMQIKNYKRGVERVITTPAAFYCIVNHPLVQASWEERKWVWKKVNGVWEKHTFEPTPDTVLNFRGLDWFL